MAKLVQALGQYRPRIEHHELFRTQDIIDEMADMSSLSKGDVSSFLQDLGGVIHKFIQGGHNISLDGIGHFSLSVSTEVRVGFM